MPTRIVRKIMSSDNLPSLPAVAIQVLRMTQAEDVSVAEIARVLEQDPALTVKVLKIANSSLFGMSRKISSLQQAMVVLGLRTLKVIVLSFSLVDTLKSRRTGGFDYAGYWRHSLTTAVAARLLSEQINRFIAGEAFVSGLLCDIGILAVCHCTPELYCPVVRSHEANHTPIWETEKQILGVTHEIISSDLLDRWGLPETLCQAVSSHHRAITDDAPAEPMTAELTRILRAASIIAHMFCADTRAGSLAAGKQSIIEGIPVMEGALSRMLEVLDAHVRETASLFSLDIGRTKSYQEIQEEAVVQLAQLSMAAELERTRIAQQEQAARRQVEQLNVRNKELTRQAATDALTGIGNRSAFESYLETACRNAVANGTPLALLLLDLDRFKTLNDAFGHQAGDEALRRVGECLKKFANDRRFPARYGGEEFTFVLSNHNVNEARDMAEAVRSSVQRLNMHLNRQTIGITASVGAVYVLPDDPVLRDPPALIREADECLYEAKRTGRNRVVFRSPELVR